MINEIKGIELVWLSQTDLTNLNAGEGGTNLVDVKKYSKSGIEYPYVSGQAMRFYLRESVRRSLTGEQFMCTPNDKGENCGNHKKCLNCDLFGYMLPKKGEGAGVRVSPVKVSTAMGLLPLKNNSTIDFLTRKKRKEEGEKASGDIVNVELGVNLYKCGISIDVQRVGVMEKLDEESKVLNYESFVEDDEKKKRINLVLKGSQYLSDYSKQARLLTDFTPDIILASVQKIYSHRLQKAFSVDENSILNVSRFQSIVRDLQEYSTVYFGILPGVIKNSDEVIQTAKDLGLEVLSPNEIINLVLLK